MKTPQEITKQLWFILISLLLSILLGFVPGILRISFTTFQSTGLRIGIFIILLLLDILWVINKETTKKIKEYKIWRICNDGDKELANIRASYFKIVQKSYGDSDIFTVHFLKEFHKIARIIGDAADKLELSVEADHFLSVDNVIDAFSGDENRIWRYTWMIDFGDFLFDDLQWKHYFEATTNNLKRKEIKEIKSILILESEDLISTPRINKLLDFFKTNKGMDCRIIIKKEFERIRDDTQISPAYKDFGIYGNRLLFLTEQYEPKIRGIFTKETSVIKNYIRFFDTMWDAQSLTRRNKSTAKKIVTLEELFKFDAQPLTVEEGNS